MFVGLRATIHDLDHSLDRFYATSQFADLTVIGEIAPPLPARSVTSKASPR